MSSNGIEPSCPTLSRSNFTKTHSSKQINIINHSLVSFFFFRCLLCPEWFYTSKQNDLSNFPSPEFFFLVFPYPIFLFTFNYFHFLLFVLPFNILKVMLYVDGMNGVMEHGPTIQWLYSLIASKYRLVVKTALKLLLVFVEYSESNCYQLVNAIRIVDNAAGALPWINIMKWVLLKNYFHV